MIVKIQFLYNNWEILVEGNSEENFFVQQIVVHTIEKNTTICTTIVVKILQKILQFSCQYYNFYKTFTNQINEIENRYFSLDEENKNTTIVVLCK